MKPPIPTTKIAYLPSAGYGASRATKHKYVQTRETVVPGPRGEAGEHLYRCEETGEVRRWGLSDRWTPEQQEGN